MCEATAFLVGGGHERKIMENVVTVHPEEGQVLLADLLGEQKVVRARVRDVDLVRLRITLEELPAEG